MIFKRTIQRYGQTPAPDTPWQRAGQLRSEEHTSELQSR